MTTAARRHRHSHCLLCKPVWIHFIGEAFRGRCDATLVCVQNDVTARSPPIYNPTTNKLSENNIGSASPLSICTFPIGCFGFRWFCFQPKLIHWSLLPFWWYFSATPLLPVSTNTPLCFTLRLDLRAFWSCCAWTWATLIQKLLQTNLRGAVVQSVRHDLRRIKGGPSGQKAIKMTCCERTQSGAWHDFYWHLFGCCSLSCWKKVNRGFLALKKKKKVTQQVWMQHINSIPCRRF